MRRTTALVFLTVFAASCSGSSILISPRRRAAAPPPQQAHHGASQAGSSGGSSNLSSNPLEALNEVARFLGQHGYQPAGPAVHNSNMAQGGLMAYAIDAQQGACYAAVAIGSAGTDLDMVILDPQGQQVGHDVQPDSTPHVAFCPSRPGRYVARLQMSSGAGSYYYLLLTGQGDVQPQLAGFMSPGAADGEVDGQPPAVQAQLDPNTRARHAALHQRLSQRHYEQVGEPQGVMMTARSDRHYPLSLQQGYCYAFATLGGPGTTDTDVFVVDGAGNELERDAATDLDALVEFCPQSDGSHSLRTRLYNGNGPVFVAGWVRPREQRATPVSTEATQGVIAEQSRGGVGLEENYRLLQGDMQARGYEAYGEPSRGQLAENASERFHISLEGGKCYAILAVGDNGVRDLDLIIRDESGAIIDRDVEADARPVVRVCPTQSGEQDIEVSMASGAGRFVYAAYRWPRGTRGPFGLSGLIYLRLAEVTSLLNVEGYQPSMDFAPENGRLRREGQSVQHRITLPRGRCFAILVVGGDGVNDLDVTLTHDRRELASDGTRNAFPSVRHCTEQGGRHDLNIRARQGAGEYFYQVFERQAQ